MCGRYTLTRPKELAEVLDAEIKGDLHARYNISPTQDVPVVRVRKDTGKKVVTPVRWGLIPFWAKDKAIGNRMINARGETVAEKPAFRTSFKRKRCGVLADGFYEWRKTADGKQPYFIHRPDREPFLFAGLWDRWDKKGTEEPIDSFTIITTAPNDKVAELHDRMPVILPQGAWSTWLDPELDDPEKLQSLLVPWDGAIDFYPVSKMVNRPQNDVPACIDPVKK